MKKKILTLICLIFCFCTAFSLGSACGDCEHSSVSDWIIDKQATCTETGTKYKKCIECEMIVENEVIEKKEHTIGDWVADAGATCETGGLKHKACAECKAILEVATIEKGEHTASEWIIDTNATCEDGGHKHKECTNCQVVLETATIDKLAHVESGWITDEEATCTDKGTKHKECTECGTILLSGSIEKEAHTPGDWVVDSEATCTEKGLKHKECTACGLVLEEKSIEKVAHEGEWKTIHNSTCSSNGVQQKVCKNCNAVLEVVVEDMLMHTPSDWIIDASATCEDGGYQHKECTNCQVVLETATIDKLAHVESGWITDEEATCENGGYKKIICTECETILETETIDKLSHEASDWIIDASATCEDGGYQHKECTNCQVVLETATIDKLAHVESGWITDEEATCTEKGTKHKECTECGTILLSGSIEKEAHTPGDWVVDSEATCTEKGLKHKECINCQVVLEIASIDKLPHMESEWIVDFLATCEESGLEHVECTKCRSNLIERIIAPTGHNYVNYKCENCGDDYYTQNMQYTLNEDGESYTLTGIGLASDRDVVIPSTYNGKPVTAIRENAFNGCTLLTSIVLPNSVTSIGYNAFENCTSLTKVNYLGTLDGWVSIDFYAYSNPLSNGADLYINNEKVTEAVITTATEIKDYAFENYTSLTSVVIGNSVTSIGKSAFSNCTSLTKVNYLGTFAEWVQIKFEDTYFSLLANGAELYINGELVTITNNASEVVVSAMYSEIYGSEGEAYSVPYVMTDGDLVATTYTALYQQAVVDNGATVTAIYELVNGIKTALEIVEVDGEKYVLVSNPGNQRQVYTIIIEGTKGLVTLGNLSIATGVITDDTGFKYIPSTAITRAGYYVLANDYNDKKDNAKGYGPTNNKLGDYVGDTPLGYSLGGLDLDRLAIVSDYALAHQPFTGTFDGLGHTIDNLMVAKNGILGVFTNRDQGALLTNVIFKNYRVAYHVWTGAMEDGVKVKANNMTQNIIAGLGGNYGNKEILTEAQQVKLENVVIEMATTDLFNNAASYGFGEVNSQGGPGEPRWSFFRWIKYAVVENGELASTTTPSSYHRAINKIKLNNVIFNYAIPETMGKYESAYGGAMIISSTNECYGDVGQRVAAYALKDVTNTYLISAPTATGRTAWVALGCGTSDKSHHYVGMPINDLQATFASDDLTQYTHNGATYFATTDAGSDIRTGNAGCGWLTVDDVRTFVYTTDLDTYMAEKGDAFELFISIQAKYKHYVFYSTPFIRYNDYSAMAAAGVTQLGNIAISATGITWTEAV